VLSLLLWSCSAPAGLRAGEGRLTAPAFQSLLDNVARAWETQDTVAAVNLFTEDAVYMQPPDVQLFAGRSQLRSYFGALKPGTFMRWHNVWFDADSQVGAGEFTFGVAGRENATHGVAVIRLREGRIASWHEYLQGGPAARERFLAIDGKRWKWHIGNYP
jgi:ketosteroid isomerase-like protein